MGLRTSFMLPLVVRRAPILIGNSATTRELKTHDSNQEKNDCMTTAPKASDSSAARACLGKLPEGPAYSAASGWGLPCEGVAFTRPGPKARWPIVGPQESATTGASRTRVLQCFHEWPDFPDSGLAEPPATRSNQQRPQLGLRVGPEQFSNCEWRRAPPPRRGGRGRGFYIYIYF